MDRADLMSLSLTQASRKIGDPTHAVFERMYERFPDLKRFRADGPDWEHAMVQEVLTHLMHVCEDPDEALSAISTISSHHHIIGVSADTFTGLYIALKDVLAPHFHGPHRDDMLKLWQHCLDLINPAIEEGRLKPWHAAH